MSAPSSPIRLLLSDVDGTLVTKDKVLTPGAVRAAQAMKAAGIGFTLTSSRPPFGVRMLVEPLGLELPIGGCNGGLLVKPDMEVIATNLIDQDVASEVVDFLHEAGLDVWLYTADEWFVPAEDAPHVARELYILKTPPRIATRFSPDQLRAAVKLAGVSDDFPAVGRAEAEARARFGDRVSAARSAHHFLDVTNPRANKGGMVDILSRTLDIPPDEIATIGDMPNDVLMFERSGFSIAMGNATDEVKSKASVATLSNEDDGFAHAVETFILPRKPL